MGQDVDDTRHRLLEAAGEVVVIEGVVEHVDGVTNFVAHRFARWSVDGIRSRDFK